MKTSYPESLAFVLQFEGGYSNHPKDPGGPTNYGITIADARKYWKHSASATDVKNMPLSVAKDIYFQRYWTPVCGDLLPAGLDICTFDSAVNSGVGRANLWLGYAIGSPAKDYATLAKQSAAVQDIPKSVKSFCAKRMSFLQSLKTWSTFGKGWGRRVTSLQAKALSMALLAAGKSPAQTKEVLQKEAKDAKSSTTTTVSTSGSGAVVTGGGSVATWTWDIPHVLLTAAAVGLILFVAHKVYVNLHAVSAFNEEIEKLEALIPAEASDQELPEAASE